MKVLGIDAATKTGWALMENGLVIESGVEDFTKRRGESNGAMFLRFRTWLQNLIKQLIVDGLFMAYEQAHYRGGAATEICTNLTGRVQEIAAHWGIEYATVHTQELKKWATGKGNADKAAMITYARRLIGREPQDDNEADAVAIASWAWTNYADGAAKP